MSLRQWFCLSDCCFDIGSYSRTAPHVHYHRHACNLCSSGGVMSGSGMSRQLSATSHQQVCLSWVRPAATGAGKIELWSGSEAVFVDTVHFRKRTVGDTCLTVSAKGKDIKCKPVLFVFRPVSAGFSFLHVNHESSHTYMNLWSPWVATHAEMVLFCVLPTNYAQCEGS